MWIASWRLGVTIPVTAMYVASRYVAFQTVWMLVKIMSCGKLQGTAAVSWLMKECRKKRNWRCYLKKVKQSLYKPGEALSVPGVWGSQISRQSAHEGGKVVSPTHLPPLPPSKYSWYSFLLEAESTSGSYWEPEGLCQWKIPVTPSGIEPATLRLVAQCLNQLRHRVPRRYYV